MLKRTWIGYLTVFAVAAIALAGTLDALPLPDRTAHPARGFTEKKGWTSYVPLDPGTESESLEPCRPGQLALAIKRLPGGSAVELSHVSGEPCRVPRMRIDLRVRAAHGQPVAQLVFNGSGRFSGDISPDMTFLATFTFLPRCNQRGPFQATVAVGPYLAERQLRHPRACVTHA
jgi:hypothetical protein